MNKIYVFVLCLLGCVAVSAQARCFSESQTKADYLLCAIQENDDEAQLYMAHQHLGKGALTEVPVTQLYRALLYFHLSADNGNALAQRELAQLLMQMDEDLVLRQSLKGYLEQVKKANQNGQITFSDELIHPYILLTLAAEAGANKWYYPSLKKRDVPMARDLLQQYPQIDDAKKQMLIRRASQWKQEKMKQAAQEVYDQKEYRQFMDRVFPEQGRADAFIRQQALDELKEKIQETIQGETFE